ncbi:DUF998 domain-containing protein [Actinomadura flavalba]|uniref:DUF998 domain-containing protein n=1 Tax=Actinomadura flavalba TaxID=1120938 RepID=UPI00036626B1|nr:DUF998 domain-containing protein [Actinomadura flavalba]
MRQEREPGTLPLFAIALFALAGITYATFVLEHRFSPDLDRINGYVSELSAVSQPFHTLYSAGDLVTGVLVLIAAATALLTLRRRPLAVAGWIFLMLFGVGAIGDALFPLDCAPSLETWCALRERAEQVSFSHQFHAVTSSLVIVFGILALFTLSLAARRYGWWPTLARWGWRLAVAEAVAGTCTIVAMVIGRWLGVIQRVQITILCAALLVVAWTLFRDWRAARREPAS